MDYKIIFWINLNMYYICKIKVVFKLRFERLIKIIVKNCFEVFFKIVSVFFGLVV